MTMTAALRQHIREERSKSQVRAYYRETRMKMIPPSNPKPTKDTRKRKRPAGEGYKPTECLLCGVIMMPTSGNQKYCCANHREQAKWLRKKGIEAQKKRDEELTTLAGY